MTRVTKPIGLHLVRLDRTPLNPKTLALLDYLRTGGLVPPIKVTMSPTGQYDICDGRHRVTAFKLLGRTVIPARFVTP